MRLFALVVAVHESVEVFSDVAVREVDAAAIGVFDR